MPLQLIHASGLRHSTNLVLDTGNHRINIVYLHVIPVYKGRKINCNHKRMTVTEPYGCSANMQHLFKFCLQQHHFLHPLCTYATHACDHMSRRCCTAIVCMQAHQVSRKRAAQSLVRAIQAAVFHNCTARYMLQLNAVMHLYGRSSACLSTGSLVRPLGYGICAGWTCAR